MSSNAETKKELCIMTKENILDHLNYHYWATGKLLDACETLSKDALERDTGGSFGSLFATLVHMYSAENIWLARWQQQKDPGFTQESAFADVRDLRNEWQLKAETLLSFAKEADTSQIMTVGNFQHSLWQMILHMIDHSSFHRGQVINMLRNEGQPPPKTNFIYYLREQP